MTVVAVVLSAQAATNMWRNSQFKGYGANDADVMSGIETPMLLKTTMTMAVIMVMKMLDAGNEDDDGNEDNDDKMMLQTVLAIVYAEP